MNSEVSKIVQNILFFGLAGIGIGLNILFCCVDSKNIFIYIVLICGFVGLIIMKVYQNKEK